MDAKCENCRWFQESDSSRYLRDVAGVAEQLQFGDCRRRAPVTAFANVTADDWCGEFEAREPANAELPTCVMCGGPAVGINTRGHYTAWRCYSCSLLVPSSKPSEAQ